MKIDSLAHLKKLDEKSYDVINEWDCGCKYAYIVGWRSQLFACPLHHSALQLLEALKDLLEICKGIPHGESLTYGEELAVDHAIKQAVTAVAAAKGEQCQ